MSLHNRLHSYKTESYLLNLGCNVVWRSTECSRLFVAEHSFFAHSEVGDLNVSFGIQHHVVQLQVSENVQTTPTLHRTRSSETGEHATMKEWTHTERVESVYHPVKDNEDRRSTQCTIVDYAQTGNSSLLCSWYHTLCVDQMSVIRSSVFLP